MLNTAAKLQQFLGHQVNALPDLVQNELDPQQYSKSLIIASQCVSEHWKELAQYLGVDPHQHWDVLEESSDADERCHGVSVYWLVCACRQVFYPAHLQHSVVDNPTMAGVAPSS